MLPASHPLTPHGPEADAAARELVSRALQALKEQKLLPVESIGHYLVGDYARAEGWVAQEGEAWVPYDTPHLFVLMPDGFEEEATAAQLNLNAQLPDLCLKAGYSLAIDVATAEGLNSRENRALAHTVAEGRQLLWSYDGHDPLEGFRAPRPDELIDHGLARLVGLGPSLRELGGWSQHELFGLNQGIVRLAFIRSIEVISGLGDAVLMKKGRYAASLRDREQALCELTSKGEVHIQLTGLYKAAIALRTRQPRPQLPAWEDLRALMREVEVWSRHVAHTHFGAQVVEPAA